jgi:ABC-type glycerol-3-phosphate transport system substrate-binding protein
MKKPRWLSILLICVCIAALSGCVPATSPAPAAQAPAAAEATKAPEAAQAAAKPADQVTLVYWRAGGASSDQFDEGQMALVKKFQDANPNIKIEPHLIPFPEYDSKSLTALQAKEGPDIIEVNSVSLGMFTSKGLVQPLDDLLSNSSIKKENFVENAWNTGIYQGKLWGLPLDTGTRIILYNKDLFKAAGVKEFGKTVTWPELLDAAKKITNKDKGIYGYAFAGGERWVALYEGFGHYAIQNNARFISDDMTKVEVNSPAMLETFKFYKELAQYAPPDAINWNDQSIYQQQFIDGKIGMYIAGFWSLDAVLKAKPDMPYGLSEPMNKVAGSSTGGWLISVPAYTTGAKRDAALKFLEYVFQPEVNAKWTSIMPNQPKSVALTLQDPRYDLFKDVLKNSRHPIPLHPKLPDMADAVQVEGQKYLLGQQTAEETLSKLQTKFEALLK